MANVAYFNKKLGTLTLNLNEYIVVVKCLMEKGEGLMTKENKYQYNKQQDNNQNKDNKRIEKRDSGRALGFERLKEHDNSSLLSIMNQIDSNEKKEK